MKKLLFLLPVICACGCGDTGPTSETPNPDEQDLSHTPAQAVEQGAPSTDKDWTPTDYVAFDAYVAKLPQNAYPRAASPNSGILFMKLVDSAEQPVLTKTDLDFDGRMNLALQMLQAAGDTMKRYTSAHNSGTDYSTELAYLLGVSLVNARQTLVLTDEFIPTIDPNDGKYEVRMDGLRKMKNGLATQLDGVILSLQETAVYADEARRIIADYLVAEAPAILSHLEPSVQREFQVKLDALASSEKDTDIRKLLAGLSKGLEE